MWAINLELHATNAVSARVDKGEVGGKDNDETRQEAELVKAIGRYLDCTYDDLPNKSRVPRSMHGDYIVPLSYLQQGVGRTAAFKGDRQGATNALNRTIKVFIDAGDLVEIDKVDVKGIYKTSGRAFRLGDQGALSGRITGV